MSATNRYTMADFKYDAKMFSIYAIVTLVTMAMAHESGKMEGREECAAFYARGMRPIYPTTNAPKGEYMPYDPAIRCLPPHLSEGDPKTEQL